MTDVDLVTKCVFSLYPFHSFLRVFYGAIMLNPFSFPPASALRNTGKSTLKGYFSKVVVVGGAAHVLIECPTPREARTSKCIDFMIWNENICAGCLNQEETSVLVKH